MSAADRAFRLLPTVAAVVAVALLFWGTNPGPRWQVSPRQQADGTVMIEGEPVPASDHASLAEQLLTGVTLEYHGYGDLELVAPGSYALQVAPGSVLTLPPPPPRWFGRGALRGRVDAGEVRLASGPRFGGARLTWQTPEAEVTVEGAGTTMALRREPAHTIVCVLEGTVTAQAGGSGPRHGVSARASIEAGAPGKAPRLEELTARDRAGLAAMRDARDAILAASRAR